MEPCQENNFKQSNHPVPTIEEVNNWDAEELLEWIGENRPKLIKGDKLETFKAQDISGDVFLRHAGDVEFFEKKCNLPCGTNLKTRKRKNQRIDDTAPSTKRARVGESTLFRNGKLNHFRSGAMAFSDLLQKDGQAYFDRTRYIFTLHELDSFILFCRPPRFGKSLTVSMLEHFHGLQYAGEHGSLYKGLDVQKQIDEKKLSPGQYFVLKLNFSEIKPSIDPKEAHENLVEFLNSSLETFYGTYAGYLGRKSNYSWGRDNPNVSFQRCADAVRCAIQQDERLGGIKGIYVLVDEYDAFPSSYLGPPKKVEGPKIAWDDTAFDRTLRAFWAEMRSLCTDGIIKRTFITGISPLSLSSLGNAFEVTRNLSFHRDLAGLCGLTYSDLENASEGNYDAAESGNGFLSEMSKNSTDIISARMKRFKLFTTQRHAWHIFSVVLSEYNQISKTRKTLKYLNSFSRELLLQHR